MMLLPALVNSLAPASRGKSEFQGCSVLLPRHIQLLLEKATRLSLSSHLANSFSSFRAR